MSKLRLQTPAPCLEEMPECVLARVFGLLGAADLAALAVQSQYLRSVAQDPYLWEPHCLARWPGADARLYSGHWCRLYQARAAMPAQFPLAADKVRALTAAEKGRAATALVAGGGSGGGQQQQQRQRGAWAELAFEEVMRSLFALGAAVSREPSLRRSPEFRALKKDMGWWLSEQPQVVVGFVRSANEALQGGFDMWTMANRNWGSTAWKRSAVAFLQDLGLLSAAHQSVVERVQREMRALDRAMGSVVEEGEERDVEPAPPGIPQQHWWYSAAAHIAAEL